MKKGEKPLVQESLVEGADQGAESPVILKKKVEEIEKIVREPIAAYRTELGGDTAAKFHALKHPSEDIVKLARLVDGASSAAPSDPLTWVKSFDDADARDQGAPIGHIGTDPVSAGPLSDGPRDKIGNIASDEKLRLRVLEGLPVEYLRSVVKWLGSDFDSKFIYRVVPKATLARRKERLSVEESERTSRLAAIVGLAKHVWKGDEESARRFLTLPHPMLGGETPIDRSLTEIGGRQVADLLHGIEYGLPV